MELVYRHPKIVSKRLQKDILSRTKDMKQFSQLITHGRTDAQTHTHKCTCSADPTRGGSAKNQKDISSRTGDFPIFIKLFNVDNFTIQSAYKGFSSSLDYLPKVNV